MKPEFITFTGIDDRTDLKRANELAKRYPIEWGVLFCHSQRDARFPSVQTVDEILSISGRKSAHVCGRTSQEVQQGNPPAYIPLEDFNRLQINGYNIDTSNIELVTSRYGVEVILQTRDQEFSYPIGYSELYDCSGGRGVLPESVPELKAKNEIAGYSGGIGIDTVHSYLGMISGEGRFWLDMEGNVRTNGWFDLDKVQVVCELVYPD